MSIEDPISRKRGWVFLVYGVHSVASHLFWKSRGAPRAMRENWAISNDKTNFANV